MANKTFVSNSTLTISDNLTEAVGSSVTGQDNVKIRAGVTGVKLDANFERIDLSGTLASYKFVVVSGTGLQIQNADSSVVATIPNINQSVKIAFTDGSATLAQTGATVFTLNSAALVVGATGAAAAVSLGANVLSTAAGETSTVATTAVTTLETNATAFTGSIVDADILDVGTFTLTSAAVLDGGLGLGFANTLAVKDGANIASGVIGNFTGLLFNATGVNLLNELTMNASQHAGFTGAIIAAGTGSNGEQITITDAFTGTGLVNVENYVLSATSNFTLTATAQKVTGSAASDTITGGISADTIDGSGGSDNISGGAGSDSLTGGAGSDTISGGTGVDTFVMTSGTEIDTITDWNAGGDQDIFGATNYSAAGTLKITIANDAGNSGTLNLTTVLGSGGAVASVTGGNGSDNITGGAGADTISGGANADTITGGADADTINAGAGDDTLIYLLSADLVTGSGISDSIVGGEGTDTLSIGTSGTSFTIATGSSWARVQTVETIKAVANSAAISITLNASAATAGITTVDISAGTAASGNIVSATAYTGTNITIVGSAAGSNTLTGGAFSDTITGGAASDTIVGGAGADSITGGAGSDVITGDAGVDTIDAGAGDDLLYYLLTADLFTSQLAVDSIIGGDGTVDSLMVGTSGTAFAIAANDSWARVSGVETITAVANTEAVTIVLNANAATAGINKVDLSLVTKTTGNSINVSTFTSATTLIGATSTGNADIIGGGGIDTITAAAAGGSITGGAGADVITAAAGTDIFVVNSIVGTSSDSAATAATGSAYGTAGDSIGSFVPGTDKITVVATNVHNFDANTNAEVGTGSSATLGAGALVANFAAATSTAATGLINFNDSDTSFGEAGDIAIGFTFASTTLTAANFRTALTYNITGSAAADTISGGENADTINGAGGDDVIIGYGKGDKIIGGDGADYIRGDATSDTYSATNTDVIFVGAETTAVGGVYPEGSDNISGTAVNSYFLDLFSPFSVEMSGVFGGANIVCGRQGADTVIASTAKDIMWYQTAGANADSVIGIATNDATLNYNGYLSGDYLGADTIHGFTIGEDAIVLTDLYGNTDHIAFGNTAAATAWTAAADIGGYLASDHWAWTLTGTGAGDLVYTSANNAAENVTIHLVGINGTVVDVNSFFFSAVA